MTNKKTDPSEILDLWFPDSGHQNSMKTHREFWMERMQGGMDAVIIEKYADLTLAAAEGALDQFPRSLWRDTPAAYAQDIKATRLALDGIENGHFDPLLPWEKNFYVIAISHCEGPDHLARMQLCRELAIGLVSELPDILSEARERQMGQIRSVTDIIKQFGRHPHRNAILGRPSTPEERAYIETGDFPHLTKLEDPA